MPRPDSLRPVTVSGFTSEPLLRDESPVRLSRRRRRRPRGDLRFDERVRPPSGRFPPLDRSAYG